MTSHPPQNPGDLLAEYVNKRSASSTDEPFGGNHNTTVARFVIQKHLATRTHYDLRLEMAGVLKSWAVPRGPCLDPTVKRLSVYVEDHPIDYVNYEGVIPDGNYGAGPMVVWDRGTWVCDGDPMEGLQKGKLLFELHGYKLGGLWTLVRTARSENEWLLIKKNDAFAQEGDTIHAPETSLLSGLCAEDLHRKQSIGDGVKEEVARLGAPMRSLSPTTTRPMLAQAGSHLHDKRGWFYELKYDGYRLLAFRKGDDVSLRYRSGFDATALFPELVRTLKALPVDHFVVDGEVVALGPDKKPSFQHLQQRVALAHEHHVRDAQWSHPVTFFCFDLLAVGDWDLRGQPLEIRKGILEKFMPPVGPVRYSSHIEGQGKALFENTRELGIEGIVAKDKRSTYVEKRSASWLKYRHRTHGDFVVVGYTQKSDSEGIGALLLAVYEGETLRYAGRVGTGFTPKEAKAMAEGLRAIETDEFAAHTPNPKGQDIHFVQPKLVVEVAFKEWTHDGHLRQPSLVGFREDKSPTQCTRESIGAPLSELTSAAVESPPPAEVSITNQDKVFWPRDGFTKGDLIQTYQSMAPWLLPYLKDRPLVLTRYPDGIDGKNFYQKNAPGFTPDWIQTATVWSEHSAREIHYFVCNNVESLTYIANLGAIPLHVWASRITDLQHPDWCILDLDPKGADFAHVVRIAKAIRALCEQVGMSTYVKTSGSTGLHVLLPLGGQCTFKQSQTLGEILARLIVGELPDIATVARQVSKREGKVYIDYLQNKHGQLLVAPYSLRPLDGAPLSMPLKWSEVTASLSPTKFTMKNALRRVKRWKQDPMHAVLTDQPPLMDILERLSAVQAH